MSTSVVQMMDIKTAGATNIVNTNVHHHSHHHQHLPHQHRGTISGESPSSTNLNGSTTTSSSPLSLTNNNHNYLNHDNNNNNTNKSINFTMKFLNANNNNNNLNVLNRNNKNINSTSSLSSTATPTTTSTAIVTTPTSSPQVQIKLEPRVPSPCTADLVCMAVNGTSSPNNINGNNNINNNDNMTTTTNIDNYNTNNNNNNMINGIRSTKLSHLNGITNANSNNNNSITNIKDLSLYRSTMVKGQQQQQLLVTTANGGIKNLSNLQKNKESQDHHTSGHYNNINNNTNTSNHLMPLTLRTKSSATSSPIMLQTTTPSITTNLDDDCRPPPLLLTKNHQYYQRNSQSPPLSLSSSTLLITSPSSSLSSIASSSSPKSLPSPSSTTIPLISTTTTTATSLSSSSTTMNGHFSIINNNNNSPATTAGLKRQHDEAFGNHYNQQQQQHFNIDTLTPTSPSSTMMATTAAATTTTTLNGVSLISQQQQQQLLNHMPTTPNNNSMVASPTSSSYSDFGGSTCKEEMSPSNSVNGYTNVDSLGDPKKKKGPVPRQQEELCLVCGDRASGYHYNALTCEGCKGFFRRSITKNAVYQCKYGNNCEIDMYMRRKCQECRLKKCLSVGMRPECVVPEYQCAMKREAKRAIKDKDKPNSTTKEGLSPNNTQMMIIEDKQPLTPIMTNNWNCAQNGDVEIPRKLTTEQDEIIRKLVFYQDEFESPSKEDIDKIEPFPYGDKEDDNKKRFQHITEMTILTVQLIVEFSKRVPFFDKLFRDDQITLLKACSSEVMMLRSSRKYDYKTDSIVYANNQPYTRQNYSSACIAYVADTLFNFCRRMHMLKVDNAEYALLTAIVIFSDRPCLLEPQKVEEIQEKYIEILRIYVETRRPPSKFHFAKLLGILTELRTLGNLNSEMCISLKVQNKKLPPFLAEIWDIQDS